MKTIISILLLTLLCLSGCHHDAQDSTPTPTPTPAPVACNNFYGMDWFASTNPKFNCDRALSVFNGIQCPVFGVLTDTFGTDYSCLKKFIDQQEAQNHSYLLRIHLTNECCRRSHAPSCSGINCCEPGELFLNTPKEYYSYLLEQKEPAVINTLKARLTWWHKWLDKNLGIHGRAIFSDGLESNFSPKAANSVDDVIHQIGYDAVWCPMRWNGKRNTDYTELHHGYKPGDSTFIHALDGYDISIPGEQSCYPRKLSVSEATNWARSNKGATAILLWHAGSQGLQRCPQTHIAPRERDFYLTDKAASILNKMLIDIQK